MTTPTSDWLHPYGIIINGVLEQGLEIAVVDGTIQEIRSSSREPEPFVLSPAFVNAHSHLEYRAMQEAIDKPEYYEWIYELTRLKTLESSEFVRDQCDLAARENVRTGVRWIGEHSDRLGSAEAIVRHRLGGWIFQEVITSGSVDIATRMREIAIKLVDNLREYSSGSLSPHAYFTVDRTILKKFGELEHPISIHVAETPHETNFTKFGEGPIADRRRAFGVPFEIYGLSVVEVLSELGVLRSGTQCVHCCAVDENDVAILASSGVTIAHCPRSNVRLQCPDAPVREFLDAGITVGLGLDSPASGGPINMFAEMRMALTVAKMRNKPLTGEEVWRMATSEGYLSFGKPGPDPWDIYVGSKTPLIRIDKVGSLDDLIQLGEPSIVSFI